MVAPVEALPMVWVQNGGRARPVEVYYKFDVGGDARAPTAAADASKQCISDPRTTAAGDT